MADQHGEDWSWGVGCVSRQSIEERRGVENGERDTISAAIRYVESFVNSLFSRLAAATDDYTKHKQDLVRALAAGRFQEVSEASPLGEKVSTIFQRFRQYEDQTETELARRYGRASPELGSFRRAKETAFDTSFAYRLFTELRNEDQHARRVIDVTATGRVVQGGRQRIIATTVRGELLDGAGARGSRWDRRTAAEVRQLSRPVDFDPLLTSFLDAMTRIEATRIAAEGTYIENAIKTLRAIANELNCRQSQPALMDLRRVNEGNRVEMRISRIDLGVIDSLQKVLQRSRDLINAP